MNRKNIECKNGKRPERNMKNKNGDRKNGI
jgi:hypothetical protein